MDAIIDLLNKFSFEAQQFPINEEVISKKKAIQLIKRAYNLGKSK